MSKRTAIDEMMADRIIPPETDLSFILLVYNIAKYWSLNSQIWSNKLSQAKASVTNRYRGYNISPPPILSLVTLKN